VEAYVTVGVNALVVAAMALDLGVVVDDAVGVTVAALLWPQAAGAGAGAAATAAGGAGVAPFVFIFCTGA
jgi:hypothetical protein